MANRYLAIAPVLILIKPWNVIFNKKEEFLPYSMTGDKTDNYDYEEWVTEKGDYFLDIKVFNQNLRLIDTASLRFSIR